MFQETIHDASNLNVFTQSGNTGAEATNPADEELDRNTLLGTGVERLDDLRVDEGVRFDKDSGRAARTVVGRFPVDEFDKAGGEIKGGDEELVEVGGFRHSREDVKERGDFGGQGGATGEQAEVGVEAGGAGMIISRSKMKVGDQVTFLSANDEENFAVGFQADESVDNVDTCFLHFAGPSDIVGFIEAGFEFD